MYYNTRVISGIDAQGWRWRRLCSSAVQY